MTLGGNNNSSGDSSGMQSQLTNIYPLGAWELTQARTVLFSFFIEILLVLYTIRGEDSTFVCLSKKWCFKYLISSTILKHKAFYTIYKFMLRVHVCNYVYYVN